jgi:hypothetical protein
MIEKTNRSGSGRAPNLRLKLSLSSKVLSKKICLKISFFKKIRLEQDLAKS